MKTLADNATTRRGPGASPDKGRPEETRHGAPSGSECGAGAPGADRCENRDCGSNVWGWCQRRDDFDCPEARRRWDPRKCRSFQDKAGAPE